MADHWGYNQQFTDKPEMWTVDGYCAVTDALGTLSPQINQMQTSGKLQIVDQLSPSSTIHDITQTGNNTGVYKIHFRQTWNQLVSFMAFTWIPAGSPANAVIQVNSSTVGNVLYGPGLAELQYVEFTTIVPNTGSATTLDISSGLSFTIRLKNSSA